MSDAFKKERIYFVKGMHCASCEILIEKRLLEVKGVKAVEASVSKGEVLIESDGAIFGVGSLNEIFKKEKYIFSNHAFESREPVSKKEILIIITAIVLLVGGFIIIGKLIPANLLAINSKSSLPAFFVFGLIAGISSCAALVGGLILSMSKQWGELHQGENSLVKKFEPHVLFNTGRLVSYGVFGMILGAIGSRLKLSFTFSSILVMFVSILMIFLGLQMLGLKFFRGFRIGAPSFIARYVADEKNFQGRYMPFLMGAFTFFLPCGFTATVQGMALLCGSALTGGLIMMFFALGTLPSLLFIGFSSVNFLRKPHFSAAFLKIAGILVLFFAFFNVNAQLNVLGLPSLNSFSYSANKNEPNDLPTIINGKQIVKMNASAFGYEPNYFKVRVGVPIRWEITDKGTGGCTNAIISRGLFDGEINLIPGKISIKEFTPQKSGVYKFSCWMGMISGIIEVIN